jgi:excisionase family DNA binding protein
MTKLVLLERQDLEEIIRNLQIENEKHLSQNFNKSSIEIIGIKEVSELTCLKEKTIRYKVSKKQMPFYQRGKPLLFSKAEILKWVNNGRRLSS